MKAILSLLLVLASCGFAEAGGRQFVLRDVDDCNHGVLQVQRVRSQRVFVQRRQRVVVQRNVGFGGSTFIRERRGPFGLFGSTTIIQN